MSLLDLPSEVFEQIDEFAFSPSFSSDPFPTHNGRRRIRFLHFYQCRLHILYTLYHVSRRFYLTFKNHLVSQWIFIDTECAFNSLTPEQAVPWLTSEQTSKYNSAARRITLLHSKVKHQDIPPLYSYNPFVEHSILFSNLRECTITGNFSSSRHSMRTMSDIYYCQIKLTSKSVSFLISLRFIDMNDTELVYTLFIEISLNIIYLEIHRSIYYFNDYYSLASMFSILSSIFIHLQTLKSLSVSLSNIVEREEIFCNQEMKILDKIKYDFPKMELLKFINIAFPSFQCDVDYLYTWNNQLMKYVSDYDCDVSAENLNVYMI